MIVFVDTSAFHALLDDSDRQHPAPPGIWSGLLRSDSQLVTTSYIVAETCSLLQLRLGMEAVRVFFDDLLPAVHVYWVSERQHEIGVAAFLAANRRKLSLVDCVSFAVMREHRTRQAFAFGQHFLDEGFDCDPR